MGDTTPGNAREWEFSKEDIYYLSGFSLEIGDSLRVKIGDADVGIGHCTDGAVWAVVMPREQGSLKSQVSQEAEIIDHLWLRFHPAEIAKLFPPDTVTNGGNQKLWARIQKIANHKINSSWQAGGQAMIPGRKDLTIDVDTSKGKRRFFVADTAAATARYVSAFEKRIVPEDKSFSKEVAESSFDQLWQEYDRSYAMFILKPEVNWNKLREGFRPKAISSSTSYEFALVCAEMLKQLRDLHIWIEVDGQDIPVFNRPRQRNSNPSAHELIIGKLNKAGNNITWGKNAEKVGFIAIDSWKEGVDEQFDEVLENMRDTRGLIIDVRLNGGGDEPTAIKVAGRFADKEYIYAYSQYRNGPNHPDLTEKYPRKVEPRGPWRYDRPVIILMGQKCMSSNESFISIMAQCPQVTTMGDHTCGSSGNPKFINLSAGVSISLPQWIDLLPDGTPLDERGVQPDVNFPTKEEYFTGNRDDLLKAAIEQLNKLPLPEKPIPGKSIQAFISERDADKPKVVSVWPPDGAKDVDPNTEIRIKFDRPMEPMKAEIKWEKGRCLDYKALKYDEKNNEFLIAIKLEAGCEHEILINQSNFTFGENTDPFFVRGFRGLNGQAAKAFKWKFATKTISKIAETKPRIISISPASDSNLSLLTELKVTFDQPMKPRQHKISDITSQKHNGAYAFYQHIDYEANNCRFVIPMVFPPKWKGSIELRQFRNIEGVEADPVVLNYSTGENIYSPDLLDRLNKAKKLDELKVLLWNIKKARSRLKSLSETVHVVSFNGGDLTSCWANFKFQGDKQFYADISPIFNKPFYVASDGKECWYYSGSKKQEYLAMIPFEEVSKKNVCICDPFEITVKSVDEVIKEFNFEYLGSELLNGHKYYILKCWDAFIFGSEAFSHILVWYIDAETYTPIQIMGDYGSHCEILHFIYDRINQPISNSEFRPEFLKGAKPENPEMKKWDQLSEDFNTRFLNAQDGSNGQMSVRWGICGPKGRCSGGLN